MVNVARATTSLALNMANVVSMVKDTTNPALNMANVARATTNLALNMVNVVNMARATTNPTLNMVNVARVNMVNVVNMPRATTDLVLSMARAITDLDLNTMNEANKANTTMVVNIMNKATPPNRNTTRFLPLLPNPNTPNPTPPKDTPPKRTPNPTPLYLLLLLLNQPISKKANQIIPLLFNENKVFGF
jgi:hypothetical protein